MSYVSYISYAAYMNYVNYMSYVCRLYDLYELYKLQKFFFTDCLKSLEITWICFKYNIFCFQTFFKTEYIRVENPNFKNENIES